MQRYEWITLNIYDPNSEQDTWDMSDVIGNSDLLFKSYFPFLIRKQVEEKGEYYKRYSIPIGYLFLVNENTDSNVLFLDYYIVPKERNKGFMNWSINILNQKLIGNTEEWADWKKEYETIMKSFIIINRVDIADEKLNRMALKNGNFIMADDVYNYYDVSLSLSLSDEDINSYKEAIEENKKLLLKK